MGTVDACKELHHRDVMVCTLLRASTVIVLLTYDLPRVCLYEAEAHLFELINLVLSRGLLKAEGREKEGDGREAGEREMGGRGVGR